MAGNTPAPVVTPIALPKGYTPPAFTPSATPVATPTPSPLVPGGPTPPANPVFDPASYTAPDSSEVDNAEKNAADAAGAVASPNQGDYTGAASAFQAEIDGLNQVYAEQKQAETINGLNRLGTNTAEDARSGLLGSGFGDTRIAGVTSTNTAAQNAIDAKHNADLGAVYAKINGLAQSNATQRVTAAQKGADATVSYLKDKAANTSSGVASAVGAYFAAGNDGTKLTSTDLANWAKTLGTDTTTIANAVKAAKASYDSAALDTQTKEATLAKDVATTANIGVPADANEFNFAVKNGYTGTFQDYQNDQDARKIAIAQASQKTTQADQQSAAVNKFANTFVPGATFTDTNGQVLGTIGSDGYINPDAWKAAIADAPAEGLNRETFIKQFGYLLNPKNQGYGLTPAEAKLVSGALPTG